MRRRRGAGSLILLGLSMVAAGALAPRPAQAGDEAVLAGLDARWTGATCVLRISLPIKDERDEQGWSHSRIYMVELEGEKPFHFRLRISDLALLRARAGGDEVRPGTVFVVEGWRPDRWGAFGGFDLDLRFRDLPLAGRFEFLAGRGFSLKEKQLADVERWLRLEACEVAFPSEALPPRPVPAQASAPAPPVAAATRSAPDAAFVPAVGVLAASVQPARVRPGEEIALVVNYRIAGLPPGAGFEVVEVRELYAGERRLTTMEDRLTRAAGTYTSSQKLRVPADLAAGLYRLRVRVRMAGLEAEGEALFAVE